MREAGSEQKNRIGIAASSGVVTACLDCKYNFIRSLCEADTREVVEAHALRISRACQVPFDAIYRSVHLLQGSLTGMNNWVLMSLSHSNVLSLLSASANP